MGEAGLSLLGCWAFRKGHHCLGPESSPSWAVPHQEPQDGERLSGLPNGPQGLGSGVWAEPGGALLRAWDSRFCAAALSADSLAPEWLGLGHRCQES